MPRAPETPWTAPIVAPARPERLPEADRPLVCVCPDYPCTEPTCLRHGIADRCPACAKHGQALYTRAEVRWVETDKGLSAAEVEALRNLWGRHDGHNSRLLRETGLKYGTGSKQPDPVTEACA